MQRCSWVLAVALLVSTGTRVQAQKGPKGGSEFEASRHGWLFSLSEGKAQAAKTGKPLMVVVRCVP
jgi:hypothetical protein